jgi:hypothetical protein
MTLDVVNNFGTIYLMGNLTKLNIGMCISFCYLEKFVVTYIYSYSRMLPLK